MTIFNSAYSTLACIYYRDTDRIKALVFSALVSGDLHQVKPGVFCVIDNPRTASIPVFNYPFVLATENTYQGRESPYPDSVVVFDARSLVTSVRDKYTSGLPIRDIPKFQAMVLHSSLALAWTNNDVNKVRDISDYPFIVFSWWLAETIVKRYTLDGNAQLRLIALAAIWYQSNFVEFTREEATNQYKTELTTVISRTIGIRLPELPDLVDKWPVIYQISDFVDVVKDTIITPKLADMNTSTLVSTVAGSWIGPIGREQIVAALEYPPQWVTLCLQAASDRGYKVAKLTQIAERNSFKKYIGSFAQNVGEYSSFEK